MDSEENNLFKPKFTLDHYETLYHGLCSQYSEAYLQGSDWYVGESLKHWWFYQASKVMDLDKLLYIYNILEIWIDNV